MMLGWTLWSEGVVWCWTALCLSLDWEDELSGEGEE